MTLPFPQLTSFRLTVFKRYYFSYHFTLQTFSLTLVLQRSGTMPAGYQLLLLNQVPQGAHLREFWRKFSLGLFSRAWAKNCGASHWLSGDCHWWALQRAQRCPLSWMLSCVVINFPGQFMPNINDREPCGIIAFLTTNVSPWNVIAVPQTKEWRIQEPRQILGLIILMLCGRHWVINKKKVFALMIAFKLKRPSLSGLQRNPNHL